MVFGAFLRKGMLPRSKKLEENVVWLQLHIVKLPQPSVKVALLISRILAITAQRCETRHSFFW